MSDKPFNKAVVFTDQHFGRSSNSPIANQDNLDFIDWFIEEARTWGAETAILCGDYFDNRHSIHVSTMDYALKGLDRLDKAFKQVYALVGNHDLLYRNKRDVTSMTFAKYLPNFRPVYEPLTIGHGRDGVTFLPWLVGDEAKALKQMRSRYIFGHLEVNGGFYMNAKVQMPDHPGGVDPDDFAKLDEVEHVFSGHFHFRQSKGKVTYIGNTFPFNFADAWDDDRGMMMLEWGKDPTFKAWPDQPQFRTFKLSDLLHTPDKYLRPKLTARCTMDIEISYEEAQIIKETFVESHGLRKLELVHQPRDHVEQEFEGEVVFQSVDQIVVDGLLSVQSKGVSPETLVEIYKSLHDL